MSTFLVVAITWVSFMLVGTWYATYSSSVLELAVGHALGVGLGSKCITDQIKHLENIC